MRNGSHRDRVRTIEASGSPTHRFLAMATLWRFSSDAGNTNARIVSALASIPIAPSGTAMASGFLVAGSLHGVMAQSESGPV
jgi:hypothetical protein